MARGGRSPAVRERLAKVVATDFPERLRKAAAEERDAKESWELKLQARDELVVEAIDVHGMPQTAVADLIGVKKGRIHGILVASQGEEGQ